MFTLSDCDNCSGISYLAKQSAASWQQCPGHASNSLLVNIVRLQVKDNKVRNSKDEIDSSSCYANEQVKIFPDKNDFEFIDFYFRVDDYTDYMLDAASLTKVSYPDWKIEANNYIADYRMGNISLRYETTPIYSVELSVTQNHSSEDVMLTISCFYFSA